MNPPSIMIVAGEASGDLLAAELVRALRHRPDRPGAGPNGRPAFSFGDFEPRFFGAGGPHMAQAGVELDFDLTRHSVIGLWEVLKSYGRFRKLFQRLLALAIERQPCAIIGVDFSGFNRRLAAAIKHAAQARPVPFNNWNPKLIQFVSPQVWASRPGRARLMSACYDLVLSIFPFELAWYSSHAPRLPVRFVGHPMLDRYGARVPPAPLPPRAQTRAPRILLLPGSRAAELKRHWPVMLRAFEVIRAAHPNAQAQVVLPNETLAAQALVLAGLEPGSESGLERRSEGGVSYSVGGLPDALTKADLAIASTGTVTMECAYFGVPTVAIYKTSWSTYAIGKRIVNIAHLAMPNIIAGRAILPELIQGDATGDRIGREVLDLLARPERREAMRAGLAEVIDSLGPPGACQRAAECIRKVLEPA